MLRAAGLWDEVGERLGSDAATLSEGQKQRLAVARALALEPEVLLLDEPTSSLDHRAGARMEELVRSLAGRMTVVMVTHDMAQARRLAEDAVFICSGRVCEAGEAAVVLNDPENLETRCYVGGS